jgi:hypothetical protein
MLTGALSYDVPEQDLRMSMARGAAFRRCATLFSAGFMNTAR